MSDRFYLTPAEAPTRELEVGKSGVEKGSLRAWRYDVLIGANSIIASYVENLIHECL